MNPITRVDVCWLAMNSSSYRNLSHLNLKNVSPFLPRLHCIKFSRTNDKKTILRLKFYAYVFIKLTFSVNGIWIKISFDTNHKKRPQGEEVQVWILLNLLNMRPRDAQFIGFMASWPHDRFWSNSILFIWHPTDLLTIVYPGIVHPKVGSRTLTWSGFFVHSYSFE